jgi:hypothetical protein
MANLDQIYLWMTYTGVEAGTLINMPTCSLRSTLSSKLSVTLTRLCMTHVWSPEVLLQHDRDK